MQPKKFWKCKKDLNWRGGFNICPVSFNEELKADWLYRWCGERCLPVSFNEELKVMMVVDTRERTTVSFNEELKVNISSLLPFSSFRYPLMRNWKFQVLFGKAHNNHVYPLMRNWKTHHRVIPVLLHKYPLMRNWKYFLSPWTSLKSFVSFNEELKDTVRAKNWRSSIMYPLMRNWKWKCVNLSSLFLPCIL